MSEHFEVGEIAIYVRPGSPRYGTEVRILSGLRSVSELHDVLTGENVQGPLRCYAVTNPYGSSRHGYCLPQNLRKKKPPQRDIDQKVSWSDCIWKPAWVTA